MKRLTILVVLLVAAACAPAAPSTTTAPTTNAPTTTTALTGPAADWTHASSELASIDATGAIDTTSALNAVLAAAPTGATIDFPANGRFRIEGTLVIAGKTDLTIDGHGSTFFAITNGQATAAPGCQPDSTSAACRYPNRTRAQWSLVSDQSITVRNMSVRGSATDPGPNGTYDPTLEAQHGFNIAGSTNVTISDVSVTNTWGDLMYIGGTLVSGLHVPSSNIRVVDSRLVAASRQGVSITSAEHVFFSNDTIDSARRSLVDLETNSALDTIAFVDFEHNVLGRSRFATFNNAGVGSNEHDIIINDNQTMPHVAFVVWAFATPSVHRSNYTVTNNQGILTTEPPNGINDPAFEFQYIDNVTVSGNTQVFAGTDGWPARTGPFGSPQAPAMLVCSTGTVTDNNFTKPSGMPDTIGLPCAA